MRPVDLVAMLKASMLRAALTTIANTPHMLGELRASAEEYLPVLYLTKSNLNPAGWDTSAMVVALSSARWSDIGIEVANYLVASQ